MTPESAWPVPYLPDPHQFAADAFVSFCVSVLLAVMINAEAQAFAATMLGDQRPKTRERFHFNAFLHLDILGTICFLAGGFGWCRRVDIDASKFSHPRLFTFLTRLAGPVANILLANIAASIIFLMKIIEYDPRVFIMVVGVNITMAIYNLLPIPPLVAGTLITVIIPERLPKIKLYFSQAGPFIIIALVLIERITHKAIFSQYLNPIVIDVFNFIKAF
ncbi:MAG: site-2 protease family protein [Thermodesulfobacteriota bacterium]